MLEVCVVIITGVTLFISMVLWANSDHLKSSNGSDSH